MIDVKPKPGCHSHESLVDQMPVTGHTHSHLHQLLLSTHLVICYTMVLSSLCWSSIGLCTIRAFFKLLGILRTPRSLRGGNVAASKGAEQLHPWFCPLKSNTLAQSVIASVCWAAERTERSGAAVESRIGRIIRAQQLGIHL
jgi:hypothetical protein